MMSAIDCRALERAIEKRCAQTSSAGEEPLCVPRSEMKAALAQTTRDGSYRAKRNRSPVPFSTTHLGVRGDLRKAPIETRAGRPAFSGKRVRYLIADTPFFLLLDLQPATGRANGRTNGR